MSYNVEALPTYTEICKLCRDLHSLHRVYNTTSRLASAFAGTDRRRPMILNCPLAFAAKPHKCQPSVNELPYSPACGGRGAVSWT